jgi:hypothetical protein
LSAVESHFLTRKVLDIHHGSVYNSWAQKLFKKLQNCFAEAQFMLVQFYKVLEIDPSFQNVAK